jgi:hypothetical protein
VLSVVALVLVASYNASLSAGFSGQASVIDGDTLEIHSTRIRLWGIDAAESNQLCRDDESLQYQCGAKAANELDAFIALRPVDCSPVSLDRYGRTVAVCSIDGVDLAEWLHATGSRWIGLSTRKGSTIRRNVMQIMRGGGYLIDYLPLRLSPSIIMRVSGNLISIASA